MSSTRDDDANDEDGDDDFDVSRDAVCEQALSSICTLAGTRSATTECSRSRTSSAATPRPPRRPRRCRRPPPPRPRGRRRGVQRRAKRRERRRRGRRVRVGRAAAGGDQPAASSQQQAVHHQVHQSFRFWQTCCRGDLRRGRRGTFRSRGRRRDVAGCITSASDRAERASQEPHAAETLRKLVQSSSIISWNLACRRRGARRRLRDRLARRSSAGGLLKGTGVLAPQKVHTNSLISLDDHSHPLFSWEDLFHLAKRVANKVPSARQTPGRGRIAVGPKRIQQRHLTNAGSSANSAHETNLPVSGVLLAETKGCFQLATKIYVT